MNNYDIFFLINDELAKLDTIEKGWRGDVLVKIGEDIFNTYIMTTKRRLFVNQRSRVKYYFSWRRCIGN